MASRVAGKIKLQSVDELLGVPEIAGTQEIEIERIHAFPNHPFKVLDDEKMDTLVDSIRENGILNPVIVRPDQSGNYEMISGHRRLHAAKIVGLKKVPAIVKEMSDDEAIIKMVDANIQREEILPSEKAFAYRMKLDALKRTAGRPTKENACHNGTHLRSDQELALQVGDSARSIQRYTVMVICFAVTVILGLISWKGIKAKAALAEQERRRAKKAEYNRRYMEKKRRQWKEQQEREKEQQEALELPAASTEKGERIA